METLFTKLNSKEKKAGSTSTTEHKTREKERQEEEYKGLPISQFNQHIYAYSDR